MPIFLKSTAWSNATLFVASGHSNTVFFNSNNITAKKKRLRAGEHSCNFDVMVRRKCRFRVSRQQNRPEDVTVNLSLQICIPLPSHGLSKFCLICSNVCSILYQQYLCLCLKRIMDSWNTYSGEACLLSTPPHSYSQCKFGALSFFLRKGFNGQLLNLME